MRTYLFKDVDPSSLNVVRFIFGALLFYKAILFLVKGWIEADYILPNMLFSYYGFEWVRPWPGHGMHIHCLVLAIASLFVMLGFLYRFSAILLFLTFTYLFLLDKSQYQNHLYLISLLGFLFIFIPAHRGASLDFLLFKTKARHVPMWSIWILRFQIFLVYFYGGLAKLHPDWLLRGEPMKTWIHEAPPFFIPSAWIDYHSVAMFFSWGGILFDLLIIPLLLLRRTRTPTFTVMVLFHIMNSFLFDIGIFPWLAIGLTTIYFSPDWPKTLLKKATNTSASLAPSPSSPRLSQRVILTSLALYVIFQLFFPLRHLLYPGDLNWTEEGRRFAWHMKSRDKKAIAVFFAKDRISQKTQIIHLRDHHEIDPTTGEAKFVRLTRGYLNHDRQIRNMPQHPEMIVQFARYLKNQLIREGYKDPEIRAHVKVSINGHPYQFMIDPEVDLTRVALSLRPAQWILQRTRD